jgi:hypothetical protein
VALLNPQLNHEYSYITVPEQEGQARTGRTELFHFDVVSTSKEDATKI